MVWPDGTTGLSYADVAGLPESNRRSELIGGELIVHPSPSLQHQSVVGELASRLWVYAKEHGGEAFLGPLDVYFCEQDVLEPDVLYIRPEHSDRIEERFVRGAPDLVVEVSSSWSRHLDRVRKRDVYERYGVPEYWYVDLDAGCVEVYRLTGSRYDRPLTRKLGETLTSPLLPDFALAIDDLLDQS
ncbi:MAG: Uma2 family endonuclease [Egibacteraceae bacterium]